MDGGETIEISVLGGLDEIDAGEWDACAAPEAADGGRPNHPFVTHRFLRALEESGSVGPGTGWAPRHLTARLGGRLIGAMPFYAKGHSQGEYIFDHNWAHAYERAGGDYYPKLLSAVPFTPATGPRWLVRAGESPETVRAALSQGAIKLASQAGVSSVHINFCTEEEYEFGGALGLMQRSSQQFHWFNRGYADFDAFLADLSSRKRKQIRRERRIAGESGVEILRLTGDDLQPEHWDAFWRFYQDTGARKWGSPYLTRRFFDLVQERMRDDTLLVMCRRNGRWVAGALNFIGRETLYGRYWGCTEHHDCLHFEVCYYQAIEAALERGLSRVEAGAQGAHKLARGYMPVETRSLHWIADPGFRRAVENYLEAERAAVGDEVGQLAAMGPFRKLRPEEMEEE